MKKLINDPRRVVRETLEGLADLHGELANPEGVLIRVVPMADDVAGDGGCGRP